MKTISLVILALTLSAQAQAYNKLVCTLSSTYGAQASVVMDLETSTGEDHKRGRVEMSFSVSECEDSVIISMSEKSYQNLKQGQSVSALIEFEDPDLKIKGSADCQYSN